MTRCFIDLWRLQTFEHSDWDRSLVASTIDVPAVLAAAERNFSMVNQMAGLNHEEAQDPDFYGAVASKLSSMSTLWESLTTTPGNVHSEAACMEQWTGFSAELFDDLIHW